MAVAQGSGTGGSTKKPTGGWSLPPAPGSKTTTPKKKKTTKKKASTKRYYSPAKKPKKTTQSKKKSGTSAGTATMPKRTTAAKPQAYNPIGPSGGLKYKGYEGGVSYPGSVPIGIPHYQETRRINRDPYQPFPTGAYVPPTIYPPPQDPARMAPNYPTRPVYNPGQPGAPAPYTGPPAVTQADYPGGVSSYSSPVTAAAYAGPISSPDNSGALAPTPAGTSVNTSGAVQTTSALPGQSMSLTGPMSPISNVSDQITQYETAAGNLSNIGGQATNAVTGTAKTGGGRRPSYGRSAGSAGYRGSSYTGGGGYNAGNSRAYEGYGMTPEWMSAYNEFWGQDMPSDQFGMYQSITDLFARYANRMPQIYDWERMWEAMRAEDESLTNMWSSIMPYDPMMQEQFVRQPLFTPPGISFSPGSSF